MGIKWLVIYNPLILLQSEGSFGHCSVVGNRKPTGWFYLLSSMSSASICRTSGRQLMEDVFAMNPPTSNTLPQILMHVDTKCLQESHDCFLCHRPRIMLHSLPLTHPSQKKAVLNPYFWGGCIGVVDGPKLRRSCWGVWNPTNTTGIFLGFHQSDIKLGFWAIHSSYTRRVQHTTFQATYTRHSSVRPPVGW